MSMARAARCVDGFSVWEVGTHGGAMMRKEGMDGDVYRKVCRCGAADVTPADF